jgi:hypothetical protein
MRLKEKIDRSKRSRSKSRSAKDEDSRSYAKVVECYSCHNKGHYIRFCRVLKQDLEDKKNKKGSTYSVSVANDKVMIVRLAHIFSNFFTYRLSYRFLSFGLYLLISYVSK